MLLAESSADPLEVVPLAGNAPHTIRNESGAVLAIVEQHGIELLGPVPETA
ncbi:hypothetical protein [Lentzea tibetensis]|uniref:hypothetical protein n=1 Tax=Lentzea tibetensis TaxID=2591470 RepID=UPI00164847ED|nr:hypothetical protein [Lentzea tibetensis]